MGSSDDAATTNPRGKRRLWRWVLVALLVLVGFVIAWLEPDEEDLFELCSTQGMPTIYRSVEADGYFFGSVSDCWGCWNYIENTDYKFIEFTISDEKVWGPIKKPGIYRASRIDASSSLCDEELTAYYTKTLQRREEFERNNWCFQLERFDERQARYGYQYQSLGRVISNPFTGSYISGQRIFYFDYQNDEVLAEATNFSLAKYPFIQVSSFVTEKHCNTFKDELGKRDLPGQAVIKPFKEKYQ
jgi:hypothetical protein